MCLSTNSTHLKTAAITIIPNGMAIRHAIACFKSNITHIQQNNITKIGNTVIKNFFMITQTCLSCCFSERRCFLYHISWTS